VGEGVGRVEGVERQGGRQRRDRLGESGVSTTDEATTNRRLGPAAWEGACRSSAGTLEERRERRIDARQLAERATLPKI
jgi:hypothetical protein